jgi:integrase
MPIYNDDIDNILTEKEVRMLYDQAKTAPQLITICLLWICGPRPSEALLITKEKIIIDADSVTIIIPTLKLRNDGQKFLVKERPLRIIRTAENVYLESIIKYTNKLQSGQKLLGYSRSWIDKTINKMGIRTLGRQISPYHFRHSATTREASQGRSEPELMYFKGAKNPNSVRNYIHARPYDVDPSIRYGVGSQHCITCKRQTNVLSTGECEP